MRIRSLNHSVYQLQYHVVWGTKYRIKYIIPVVKNELIHCLYEIIKKYPTLHIFAINTNRDHVHIQLEAPPSIALSSVVQSLKGASSIQLRKSKAWKELQAFNYESASSSSEKLISIKKVYGVSDTSSPLSDWMRLKYVDILNGKINEKCPRPSDQFKLRNRKASNSNE